MRKDIGSSTTPDHVHNYSINKNAYDKVTSRKTVIHDEITNRTITVKPQTVNSHGEIINSKYSR